MHIALGDETFKRPVTLFQILQCFHRALAAGLEGQGLGLAYAKAGYASYMQQKYAEALDYFLKAKESMGESTLLRNNIDCCFFNLGNAHKAREQIDAGLRNQPNDMIMLHNKGIISVAERDFRSLPTLIFSAYGKRNEEEFTELMGDVARKASCECGEGCAGSVYIGVSLALVGECRRALNYFSRSGGAIRILDPRLRKEVFGILYTYAEKNGFGQFNPGFTQVTLEICGYPLILECYGELIESDSRHTYALMVAKACALLVGGVATEKEAESLLSKAIDKGFEQVKEFIATDFSAYNCIKGSGIVEKWKRQAAQEKQNDTTALVTQGDRYFLERGTFIFDRAIKYCRSVLLFEPKDVSTLALLGDIYYATRNSKSCREAIRLYELAKSIDPTFPGLEDKITSCQHLISSGMVR